MLHTPHKTSTDIQLVSQQMSGADEKMMNHKYRRTIEDVGEPDLDDFDLAPLRSSLDPFITAAIRAGDLTEDEIIQNLKHDHEDSTEIYR